MGKLGMIITVLYVLTALYLVNMAFQFVSLAFLISIEKWILVVAAVLLLLGGLHYKSKAAKLAGDL